MSERHDWTHAQAQSEIAHLREALAKAEALAEHRALLHEEAGIRANDAAERADAAEALLAEAGEALDQLVTFCGSEDTALVETRHIRAGRAFIAKLKQREGSP
jgi:hypothetical protein